MNHFWARLPPRSLLPVPSRVVVAPAPRQANLQTTALKPRCRSPTVVTTTGQSFSAFCFGVWIVIQMALEWIPKTPRVARKETRARQGIHPSIHKSARQAGRDTASPGWPCLPNGLRPTAPCLTAGTNSQPPSPIRQVQRWNACLMG